MLKKGTRPKFSVDLFIEGSVWQRGELQAASVTSPGAVEELPLLHTHTSDLAELHAKAILQLNVCKLI